MIITNITDDNMSLCNCADDDMMLAISPLFLILAIIPCLFSIICVISFSICCFINKN